MRTAKMLSSLFSFALVVGTAVTWTSLFLIGRTGEHLAIVGTGDVDNVRATGAWPEVIGYVQASPGVPVVGQPLTLRLSLDDPTPVGAAVALPYESVRAGDVVSGAMRTTGRS